MLKQNKLNKTKPNPEGAVATAEPGPGWRCCSTAGTTTAPRRGSGARSQGCLMLLAYVLLHGYQGWGKLPDIFCRLMMQTMESPQGKRFLEVNMHH